MATRRTRLEVVDLFAGPGGLGEGFSSFRRADRVPFNIRLSIEKDPIAHQTLELRAFFRRLNRKGLADYRSHLQGRLTRSELFGLHAAAAGHARSEAVCMELSEETRPRLRQMFKDLNLSPDSTVVVGGPPCQAYSVAGRSRNGAKPGWTLERDHRSTLYLEYLHALAELQPVGFVMENVRGLTSARVNGDSVLRRILEDLQHPGRAIRHKGPGHRYRLIPLAPTLGPGDAQYDLLSPEEHPENFLIHAERYGIPQMRTRLIIVGLREDVTVDPSEPAEFPESDSPRTVRSAIAKLPRVRSGISAGEDDLDAWLAVLRSASSTRWFSRLEPEVRAKITSSISAAFESSLGRGSEFIESRARASSLRAHLNHRARGHMETDIHRYLFAASWAAIHGVSPTLRDFPEELWPEHGNVQQAIRGGTFADRFRVQCWDAPATTVVSHISKDGHYYIHPDASQCRSLTVREAAELQTFPRDYFFCGPRTAQYHQVGNAVPVDLSRQIAGALHRLLGSP